MSNEARNAARDRIMELAADPKYRPYVIGYLLSCLDERHWQALVESAIEFVDGLAAAHEADMARLEELRRTGG